MKKIIAILIVIVFLGAAFPTKAAPVLIGVHDTHWFDPPTQDAIWDCISLKNPLPGGDNTCTLPNMSPFEVTGSFSNPLTYFSTPWYTTAQIVCPPENTDCWKDYGVYYYFDVSATWSARPEQSLEPDMVIEIHNLGYIVQDTLPCGSGAAGMCHYIYSGFIADMSSGYPVFSLTATLMAGDHQSATVTGTAYLSLFPRATGCSDSYVTPEAETFEIVPTIETPLGPQGTPPDDQIYTTVVGSLYGVNIAGGPWNDGTADRTDVVVSWDGATWFELSELDTLCQTQGSGGDITGVVVEAESTTFYVRVNDTAGNFANNTNNPNPMTYSIGYAYELAPPCESQYTYTEDDLISTLTVNGNDADGSGAVLTEEMTFEEFAALTILPFNASVINNLVDTIMKNLVGQWFAIKVTSGTWQDDGVAPDRTDMEFEIKGHPKYYQDETWRDLSSDSTGVGCQSTDGSIWFIQARNLGIYLRVNNETGGFETNTGTLNVSIYRATFERALAECEYSYELYGSPYREDVSASAENGASFAYVPAADDPFANTYGSAGSDRPADVGNSWSVRPLEVGAWYVLDTIEGPWNIGNYDMAVSDDSGDTWQPLADWTVPLCNVPTDSLGHRRIYFQVPTGPLEWFLRVNDSGAFGDNTGSMAWNLYRGVHRDPNNPDFRPWSSCMDDRALNVLALMSPIPVKLEEGTYLKGSITSSVGANGEQQSTTSTPTLSVGYTYGVQLLGGPWDDDETDDVDGSNYDAAVSNDNGLTWHPIDTSMALGDCVGSDQQDKYFNFSFTVADGEVWKIRVNDETGDFGNNGGNLSYTLWNLADLNHITGNVGTSMISSCNRPIMRPTLPTSLIDVPSWLGWVGDMTSYVGAIMRRFFTLCPEDVDAILLTMNRLKGKEPLASVYDALNQIEDLKIEIASYAWGDTTGMDTSIFSIASGGDLQSYIEARFFPNRENPGLNPWEGDDLIDVNDFTNGDWAPSSYYSVCLTMFDGYLPSRLAQGVCFASAAFRDTGASFWIQLGLDISALGFLISMLKRPLQEVIYMMTGVKPWTKSGAGSAIDKLISHLESRDRVDAAERHSDPDADELSRRFGGRYGRNSDGTYRRLW